jgi:hypothetical protein
MQEDAPGERSSPHAFTHSPRPPCQFFNDTAGFDSAFSELVNERRGISPEMAIRLAKAFGSTPEAWAGLQFAYDMAQAMKEADRIKVQRIQTPALGAE